MFYPSFKENEKKYQTHIGSMEEDYGNQINGLKDQIKEKIEIINKLMEDQETVTTVPAPSSRVFRKDFLMSHNKFFLNLQLFIKILKAQMKIIRLHQNQNHLLIGNN